jgi:hypothetical protein
MGRLHKAHEVVGTSGSTDALVHPTTALVENIRDAVEMSREAVRTNRALLSERSWNGVRPDAARSEEARDMHELGNHMVGVLYCLRQLGGRQRTGELEAVVRAGLESCEQSVAAFRKLHKALRVHTSA